MNASSHELNSNIDPEGLPTSVTNHLSAAPKARHYHSNSGENSAVVSRRARQRAQRVPSLNVGQPPPIESGIIDPVHPLKVSSGSKKDGASSRQQMRALESLSNDKEAPPGLYIPAFLPDNTSIPSRRSGRLQVVEHNLASGPIGIDATGLHNSGYHLRSRRLRAGPNSVSSAKPQGVPKRRRATARRNK